MHLLFGGPTGLTPTGGQYILTTDLLSEGLRYVRFTATFGDFNRDGRADLVLASGDGPLMVLHGHEDGLHIAPLSHATTPGQDGDWGYGSGEDETAIRAAAGDFTGDGYPDLVFEGGYETVKVILGSSAGLVPDVTSWSVPAAEYSDLAVLTLSGGSHASVAATREPQASNYAGAVTVVRGTPAGTPGPATVWSQDSPGIKGASEPYDGFGNVIGG